MEYCNRGSLQTAVPKGVFQRVGADGVARPNQLAILTTASQLASAMAYVHSQVLPSPSPKSSTLQTLPCSSLLRFLCLEYIENDLILSNLRHQGPLHAMHNIDRTFKTR